MCQFLCITREFSCQNAKQFIENGFGNDELVSLLHDAPERSLAMTSGKYES